MKLFRVILIVPMIIGLFGGIAHVNAQTDSTKVDVGTLQRRWDERGTIRPDTTKFDSLTWTRPKAKEFRSWEVGAHLGFDFPTTDISASDINADYAKEDYVVGLTVGKFFTHTFGLQLEYNYLKLSGQSAEGSNVANSSVSQVAPYGYNTTIYADVTLNAVFHFGNIKFLSRSPRWGIYGSIGVGLIHFTPVNDSAGITVNHNYYIINYNGPPVLMNYANTTEYVIPFSAEVRYLISDRFSANLNYTFHATRTDKLDGWWRVLSEDDNYTTVTLGLTYHIGDKKKGIIEWVDPIAMMYDNFYNQLNRLKATVDSLKKDSDGDGVSDYFDKDNQTPKGFMVYGNGTAVDFDGDGVPDAIDFCPTVAGPASNHGCPIEKVAPIESVKQPEPVAAPANTTEEEKLISEVIKNLQFETAKSIIRESSFVSLNELANYLKSHPTYRLLIEGHTDNVGGAAYNMKLSVGRSNAVKQYFIDKGIDASRLEAHGYGLTRPVADNKTPEGRQMNRRVDFTLIK